ncbi:hypothetical protein JW998_00080, partial [candidate division KSB1 bacterium]|nr:hypothetical protein [candidate division KSB1 bacterium]
MANQFAIVGRQVHLHNADVFGNAAVGNNDACSPAPSYNMKFESPGVLHGIAYTEEGALLAGETSNALGGIVLADAMVVQAFSEAMDAYNTAITLIPDQTITGNISSTTTITATHGGQYVIRITGDITKSLILNPAPGTITKFIVIVEGTINLGGSDTVGASGPAGASDVLIVIEGAGNDLKSHVDNKVYGTMLAPYRGAEFHGFAGAMISGCEYVKFQSDAQLEYHGYQVNDWGDAPDSYGTRFASDGPRHVLNPYLWLGATIDPDNDGQPTVDADGDDLNGTPDDEDGLSLPLEFVQGTAANVDVSVFNTTGQTATLVGYLDLNGDGDFLDSGDKKSTTIPHSSSGISTTVTLTWDIPTGAPSTTYARFRLSTNATAIGQPTGAAPDGEIEDYSVTINEPSSLGDRIWYDRDKDGIQDDGEPGIDGVTVKLHKSDGTTLVSTTTSSGGGAYLFDNLTPDDYIVEFVPPSGFTLALQHQGVDETLDSDADPTTGRTQLITLTSGQSNLTIDAGLHNGIYFPDDSCLGEAGTFAIFGVEGGSIIINSATDLIGDVGYSANLTSTTNAKAGDDGLFNGTVWVHGDVAAFAYSDKDFLPQGGIAGYPTPDADINARLDEANDDALYAWTSYGNSAPDIQLGVLGDNDSRTVNRVDNITVVEITSLDYNSDVLELIGLAGMDDAFIINVLGDFQFSQSEIRLTNVRPERVVFNFPNVSDILINKDASIFMGTILAPTSDMEYHNPATFEGAIVAKNINVHSDFNLTHKPLDIPCEENELDFGDAPDTGAGTASGNYNTLFADNGPRHIIVPNLRLGDDVDAETDGYQSTNANGDDTHNRDDEDGVLTSLVFARGETAAVDISVYNTTGQTATLVGYMDLNGDGDFLDANEKQTTTIPHSSGGTSVTVTLSWPVPQDAPLTTYARFRVSTDAAAAEQPTGLAPNGEVEDYLATIVESASLGNYIWDDLNNDGIQDAGEPGVDGVTVNLYKSDGTTLLGTTTTAGGGIYGFANLAPGDYIVEFVAPVGWGFTKQDQGSDDTKDSDADPTTGRSHIVSLDAGENDPTIDAGLVELGSIAGTVWEDTDKDGIYQSGESPLPNLTITLYDSDDNVVATTTT